MIGLLAAYLAVNLFALIGETHGELFALIFLLLYGRLIVAVVFGVIAALRQRLKEIEGGEEEEAMGADAIVNIRFGSSAVMQGAAEVIAYGTAVKLK